MDSSDSSCRLKRPQHKIYVYMLMVVIIYDYVMFPLPTLAKELIKTQSLQPVTSFSSEFTVVDTIANTTPLVLAEVKEKSSVKVVSVPVYSIIKDHGYHSMTAYNSEVGQTDGDPCTTANGYNLCKNNKEDTVASNFLKFGTKVRIPELFGDRIFVVRDRMNSRYQERVDVWFKNRQDAINFGVRKAKIEIVEEVK